MREIGGYLCLETNRLPMRHERAIALNSGRNCLAYLIEKKNIKKIYLPKFLCASVSSVCKRMKVTVEYYSIGENLCPILNQEPDGWLYIVNYYGQLDNRALSAYKEKYKNVIIDNIQAYYQDPCENTDTIYTCRKFFGVTDGAFLYSDAPLDNSLEVDESWSRFEHIIGSFEKGASCFYTVFTHAEEAFENMPVRRMSRLTDNLLHGIDYEFVKNRRNNNFTFLHESLRMYNRLDVTVPAGPYMYPLYIENGAAIRIELQKRKIFIPTLWPDVFELCSDKELEYDLAKNILPIPVDQRYTIEDMKMIAAAVKELAEKA